MERSSEKDVLLATEPAALYPAHCFDAISAESGVTETRHFVFTGEYATTENGEETYAEHLEYRETNREPRKETIPRARIANAAADMRRAHCEYRNALALPTRGTALGKAISESLASDRLDGLIAARAHLTKTVRETIALIEDTDIASFANTWNAMYDNSLAGAELTLARTERERIVFVGADGRLALRTVESANARALLEEVKAIDRALSEGANSYELRRAILHRSGGELSTTEAMTYGSEELEHPRDLYGYIADESHWVPERALMQREIRDLLLAAVYKLAERLEPGIYTLRGNTGTGKSYGIKHHPMFEGAVDPDTGEVEGTINPDLAKHALQHEDVDKIGRSRVASAQVHLEGVAINQRILDRVTDECLPAVIVDQRHLKLEDIERRAEMAMKVHESLKILDVDAPLMSSYISVLLRDQGMADPLVRSCVIDDGFVEARKERKRVQEFVRDADIAENYVLYVRHGEEMRLVAEKIDGIMYFKDPELNDEATRTEGLSEDVAAVRDLVLTNESIEFIASHYPAKAIDISYRLLPFVGKTFAEAIDERAKVE